MTRLARDGASPTKRRRPLAERREFATMMRDPTMCAVASLFVHEAGHAVVAHALGLGVRSVTAKPFVRGRTILAPLEGEITDIGVGCLVAYHLAGFAAERWFGGIPRKVSLGHAEIDLRRVDELSGRGDEPSPLGNAAVRRAFPTRARWTAFAENWYRMATWLVAENSGVVMDVFAALYESPTLRGTRLRALLSPTTNRDSLERLRAFMLGGRLRPLRWSPLARR